MSVKFHEAFALDSAQDHFWWNDHFLGDQLQDEWGVTVAGAGTAVVVDQQTGGIVRLTTGAVNGNTTHVDWGDIRSLHVDQRVSMEYRLKLNDLVNVLCFDYLMFGFNDCINFQYNSAVDTNWQIRCRNGGGAGTVQDSGIVVDTDYHIFRIECHTHGSNHVHYYIDGTETANSPINTNVPDNAADYLQPRFWIQTSAGVAKSKDVDYCAVRQDR